MPSILNNFEQIKKLDKQNMLESIEMLPEQIGQVLRDFKKIAIPKWEKISNIVVCGMGGSALGACIIKSAYFEELKVPLEIVNNYFLPGWVGKNSLVIIFSYSGNTEESLSCLAEAGKKTSMVFAMTSGGKLAKEIADKKISGYIFDGKFNPCGEPRMGLGYSLFSQVLLFKKLNIIKISDERLGAIPKELNNLLKKFSVKNSTNAAKDISLSLQKFIPVIVAADFLAGSAHTFSNQINENAKTFTGLFPIPEVNHHLMEGLRFPENKNILKFFLIKSKLYHPRNKIRFDITEKVLKLNKIKYISYECAGQDKLTQILELLSLGSYVGFYLAMLHKIDPSPIPNVDFFKQEMGKNR